MGGGGLEGEVRRERGENGDSCVIPEARDGDATFLEGRISSEAIFWMKDALPPSRCFRPTDRPTERRGRPRPVVVCECDRPSKQKHPLLSAPPPLPPPPPHEHRRSGVVMQFCGG